jgi:hypothetical protein
MRSLALAAALALGFVLLPTVPPISAGPEKVVFPSGAQRSVLYAEVDRPDLKQVRRLFAAPETARGAKAGAPLPAGALLTMEIYAARTDDRGEPLRDGSGRLVRGDLTAVFVMEKRAGWGAEYPDDLRNGEWEYARFTADGRLGPADTRACLACHKPKADQDYVFSSDKLIGAR